MSDRPPSIKTIKRRYVAAHEAYQTIDRVIHEVHHAQALLPHGILEPALDLLHDKRDAAVVEYRTWFAHCQARKIQSALGYKVLPGFVPEE